MKRTMRASAAKAELLEGETWKRLGVSLCEGRSSVKTGSDGMAVDSSTLSLIERQYFGVDSKDNREMEDRMLVWTRQEMISKEGVRMSTVTGFLRAPCCSTIRQ